MQKLTIVCDLVPTQVISHQTCIMVEADIPRSSHFLISDIFMAMEVSSLFLSSSSMKTFISFIKILAFFT